MQRSDDGIILRQAVTEANGGFSFGDVSSGGPYELRVEGHDHAPVLRPGLWIAPNQRLDVGTLWLADGVRVNVEVRSFDGRPLENAVVRAFTTGAGSTPFDSLRDPSPVAAARSGSDGWARFEGLPPGTWTFTAERAGYARRGLIGVTVRDGVDEESFHVALERGYRLSGRVLDRHTIFSTIWGIDHIPNSRTLDQHISQLRKRIEVDPKHPDIIQTAHGVGYRFDES